MDFRRLVIPAHAPSRDLTGRCHGKFGHICVVYPPVATDTAGAPIYPRFFQIFLSAGWQTCCRRLTEPGAASAAASTAERPTAPGLGVAQATLKAGCTLLHRPWRKPVRSALAADPSAIALHGKAAVEERVLFVATALPMRPCPDLECRKDRACQPSHCWPQAPHRVSDYR